MMHAQVTARSRVALTVAALGLAALAAAFAACNGDDDSSAEKSPVVTATGVAATRRPNVTTAAPSPNPSGQEVVGIVGAVNQRDNRIEINMLSGADVDVVLVTPATRILGGQGRALTLADLRPSDRIIASGTVDGPEMTADRVEIQAVLPGASPGG